MLLSRILEGIEYESVKSFSEREIKDVSQASGDCTDKTLFVAICGSRHNGNDFIGEARRHGCKAFVSEKEFETQSDETLIISKNPRKSLAEIAKLLYGNFLNRMTFIGITGTKGKTATAKYTASLLTAAGRKCVLSGTLGVSFYGVDAQGFSTENTTPDAATLYKALGIAAGAGAEVAVIEISSQALMQERVLGIPFDICVFTNFSPDHIGEHEHKSVDEYFCAKRSLFCDFGAHLAIVNEKDKHSKSISEGVEKVIFAKPKSLLSEDSFRVKFEYDGEEFSLPTAGSFNAENAALALAAAKRLTGLDTKFFKSALENTRVEGRFEAYRLYGKTVIIDFAHNAASFLAVMSEARRFTKGKLIAVFGSVGGRCRKRRRELAETAEKYADISVITSDNPDFEDPSAITEEIFGFYKNKRECRKIPNRIEAIAYAVGMARAGDTVLLLGKGHEHFQLVRGEKKLFSERAIVLALGGALIG